MRRRLLVLGCALLLGCGAPAALAAAGDPGVQDVTAVPRVTATRSEVVVAWRAATPAQRVGLSWTSVYFGRDPQPILVFSPAIHDVTIPDVAPGTYDVKVEFAYGPRSDFTYTGAGVTRVTVPRYVAAAAAPLPPTHVTATVSGHRVTVSWGHNRTEAADQRPDDYLVTVGRTTVTVARGYANLSATVGDVPSGNHPVTVTARNEAGDSPAASGGSVRVAPRAAPKSSRGGSERGVDLTFALAALGLLVGAALLVRSLHRNRERSGP